MHVSTDTDRAVRRATIQARWGEAGERRLFDNPGVSVEVLKWDRGRNPRGVTLYLTIGTPVTNPQEGHVDEYMLGLDPDAPNAGWVLAALAGLRAQGRGQVRDGSVVSFDEPLWSGTEIDSVLILSSDDEQDRGIPMSDGRHLSLLTVVPVYSEEYGLVRDNGADALLEKWEKLDVEYWNPYRAHPGSLK